MEARDADYPVMLSKTSGATRGRPIRAESSLHGSASKGYVTRGDTTVLTLQVSSSQSEVPAADKFAAQVKRAEKWVQIEHLEFQAKDTAVYGIALSDRKFIIEGSAH